MLETLKAVAWMVPAGTVVRSFLASFLQAADTGKIGPICDRSDVLGIWLSATSGDVVGFCEYFPSEMLALLGQAVGTNGVDGTQGWCDGQVLDFCWI